MIVGVMRENLARAGWTEVPAEAAVAPGSSIGAHGADAEGRWLVSVNVRPDTSAGVVLVTVGISRD